VSDDRKGRLWLLGDQHDASTSYPPLAPVPRDPDGVLERVREHRDDLAEGYAGKLSPLGWHAELADHAGQIAHALVNRELQGGDRERYRRAARRECVAVMAAAWALYEELLVGEDVGA
jgi:hypothetical protein